MTTIAWDGKTMASDTQAIRGGYLKRSTAKKIFVCDQYAYGGTGSFVDVLHVAKWLESGARSDDAPLAEEDYHDGLAVERTTGAAFFVEGKKATLVPCDEPFWAIGSGRDFALAAMALGKSAPEAVALAIRFDAGSGGSVETVTIDCATEPR